MTLHIMEDIEQGSPEWFDQRRGIVTASVIGQLLSVGTPGAISYGCPACSALANDPCRGKRAPFEPIKTLHSERAAVAEANKATAPLVIEVANDATSAGLIRLLTAERITGWTDPSFTTDAMWMGREGEPLAREKYAENYDPVETVGFMIRDDWGFPIGCSPDGLVGDDGMLEIKTRLAKNQVSTVLADKVPAANMAQCQAALLVSGRKWLDYVSYCSGMNLWVKRVYPDQRWFDAIVAAAKTFEAASEDMANRYFAAIEGLPRTERITNDLGLVF